MKKKNNYLKEAGVLLITIGLIATCMTVTANTFEKNQNILFEQNPPGPDNPLTRLVSDSYLDYYGNWFSAYDNFWDVTYPIYGISWWGVSLIKEYGNWVEPCEPTEMLFTIVFYEDDNGEPGTVVCSYENVMPVITDTGITYYSEIADMYFNLYYYEVSKLDTSCDLSSGWVSVMATDGDNCVFCWQGSIEGNNECLTKTKELTNYDVWDFDLSFVLKTAIPEMLMFDGETSGKTGEEQSFSICATCSGGSDVSYYIEWGDDQISDWFGPHPSDEVITVNHTWAEQGNYTIQAKAKNDIGMETDWMYLEVSMPRNKLVDSNKAIYYINDFESQPPPASWLKGSDQTQTICSDYGFIINPIFLCSQKFKPSKGDLTAVALPFFKFGSLPSGATITVAIREELDGNDLISTSINADSWKIKNRKETWILFDFEDIDVIPEESYYIVCTADKGNIAGNDSNVYCWNFEFDNKYDRGIAFQSNDSGETWYDLENYFDDPEYVECDFAFITYHQEPQSKTVAHPFLRFLENHPYLFPLIRQILELKI